MKRVMIIGAVGAGKSSLVRALEGDDEPARKTQTLEFHDWIIDTPGEYSENPLYYRTLMATSLEAGLLLMVQDATRDRNYFPPGFSQGFPVAPIGVVTKMDHPDADAERARTLLHESLAPDQPVFLTSAATGAGIAELRRFLLDALKT
ncbi:EutP/PduV family microcompartment system protein [Brevibacillus fluminis]|uniref:EutP/PduV family microcompartment system protein n=1 Tax=Brevibacillus fluminis TaxID=511487 RepID=UPI003F8A83A1